MTKIITLTLITIALLACASYVPTDFQNADTSATQDQYNAAFEECADIAKNVDISDPEAMKIAKAGLGAAGGYVAGGAISIGTVIATGAAGSAVAMPVVLLGVIGGSLWGANAATSEKKERDTVLASCLNTKGYRVSK